MSKKLFGTLIGLVFLAIAGVLILHSQPAWATLVVANDLPAPGVVGLIAVGVVGAIILARRRK